MKQGEQIRRKTGTRGTVEPEETSIASQRLRKQVSASNDRQIVGNDVFYSVSAKWL
jgi:hypothetical protein